MDFSYKSHVCMADLMTMESFEFVESFRIKYKPTIILSFLIILITK